MIDYEKLRLLHLYARDHALLNDTYTEVGIDFHHDGSMGLHLEIIIDDKRQEFHVSIENIDELIMKLRKINSTPPEMRKDIDENG